jgi:AcrR family transcriptional regulator
MSMAHEARQAKRLRAHERAALIERAATQLFARNGYASTSVEDIVTAAGVTKPMLYRHFESKQELCIRLLERYRDGLITAPLSRFSSDGPQDGSGGHRSAGAREEELAQMIDAWLSWVQEHPDASRLLFTPVRGDDEVERVQRELHVRQRDTQSALLREFIPGLAESDAEPLAEITRAGFAAIALWWLDHSDRPRADARRALLSMAQGIVGSAQFPKRKRGSDAAQQGVV